MKLTLRPIGGLITILSVLLSTSLNAQFKDNFDDGNLFSNPQWNYDTAKFKSINGKLQSQSLVVNDKFSISTASQTISNTQWEFNINLQFNTSSANYVDVFLASDSANLMGNNSGYYLRIGNTADNICLYKKTGASTTPLITGRTGVLNHSNNIFSIKVTCDANFNFILWRDSTGIGTNYLYEGSAKDNSFTTSNFFGIVVKQSTASFHSKHYFDDFYVGKIITDTINPFVKSFSIKSEDTLNILFSEKLALASLDISNFEIDNGIGKPVYTSFINDSTGIELAFNNGIDATRAYYLEIKNCRDKAGNLIIDTVIQIVLPQIALPGEIIINEILFNPATGGSDFIEIYNNSDKILSLKNLTLFNYDEDRQPDYLRVIDTNGIFILPVEFRVLTVNPKWLSKQYKNTNMQAIHALPSLPSMNDGFGNIGIKYPNGPVIDELDYDESMHLQLLTDFEGVSLERISYDVPASEKSNWTSAASTSGFATPGLVNSHSLTINNDGEWLTIEPDLFSPDDDGMNDIVSFTVTTLHPDQQTTLMIFDPQGRLVITLANNVPAGSTQTWFWDGMDKYHKKTPIGIYIVYAELFGTEGKHQVRKKTVTLGGR